MTAWDPDMAALWLAALDRESRPEDAIALLADACALGLSLGDFDPTAILQRLCDTFNALHIEKHRGGLVQ